MDTRWPVYARRDSPHNRGMAEPAPHPEAAPEPTVFEQPLNERMRTFLRLDFLYTQALYHNEKGNPWGSRAAVASLLDIMAIMGRGDVRGDVLKELEHHLTQLNEFQHRPGIDTSRLRALITNLTRLRTDLGTVGSNWLQPLRDSEFLSAIKHRSAIPGGTCEFDLPDYFFWLNQAPESRIEAFARWLQLLQPLCDAIAEVLWLTRQNGRAREEVAAAGVFHVNFDRENPYQLLRICLPGPTQLYPEISGSHYRCSLRFLEWRGIEQRPTQAEVDVPFTLVCCH
jgi:cell division protein ZapD